MFEKQSIPPLAAKMQVEKVWPVLGKQRILKDARSSSGV